MYCCVGLWIVSGMRCGLAYRSMCGYWGIEDRPVAGSPGSSSVLLRRLWMTPPSFGDKSTCKRILASRAG